MSSFTPEAPLDGQQPLLGEVLPQQATDLALATALTAQAFEKPTAGTAPYVYRTWNTRESTGPGADTCHSLCLPRPGRFDSTCRLALRIAKYHAELRVEARAALGQTKSRDAKTEPIVAPLPRCTSGLQAKGGDKTGKRCVNETKRVAQKA